MENLTWLYRQYVAQRAVSSSAVEYINVSFAVEFVIGVLFYGELTLMVEAFSQNNKMHIRGIVRIFII